MESLPESASGNVMGRRSLMKAGSVGAAAAVAGLGATAVLASPAGAEVKQDEVKKKKKKKRKAINLRVEVDFGTFHNPDSPTGSFYIGGPILTQAGNGPIGYFHCWGFFVPPDGTLALVSQEFNLDGRGKILIAGVEGSDPRGVIGGTGDFANARGEGIPTGGPGSIPGDLDNAFKINFSLVGAKGKPIK
jgi:hypothetical protein